MPLNIPTFTLQEISKYTKEVVIALLIASNAYFISKSDGNNDEFQRRLDRSYREKDSIAGKYFDIAIDLQKYKELNVLKDSALVTRDSLLRKKTEKSAIKIINKE